MQPGNIIDLKYNREAKQHGGQNKKFQILDYQRKVRNRENDRKIILKEIMKQNLTQFLRLKNPNESQGMK